MKLFDGKSIILGVGIGAIVISFASMIYTAGFSRDLSKEEIISKAKVYGMVEKTEVANTNKVVVRPAEKAVSKATPVSISTPTPTPKEVIITINPGDTSEKVSIKLLSQGLIKSKEEFINLLNDRGLSEQINIGEYKFIVGTDINYIMKKVTSFQ